MVRLINVPPRHNITYNSHPCIFSEKRPRKKEKRSRNLRNHRRIIVWYIWKSENNFKNVIVRVRTRRRVFRQRMWIRVLHNYREVFVRHVSCVMSWMAFNLLNARNTGMCTERNSQKFTSRTNRMVTALKVYTILNSNSEGGGRKSNYVRRSVLQRRVRKREMPSAAGDPMLSYDVTGTKVRRTCPGKTTTCSNQLHSHAE